MREDWIDSEQLQRDLVRKFKRIARMLDSDEVIFPSLFMSPYGRDLGNRIDDAIEFALKCLMLSMPFREIWSKLRRLLNDKQVLRLARTGLPATDQTELRVFKRMIRAGSKDMVSEVFDEEDRERFLAYLTMSVYSYLEAYVESLLFHIAYTPDLSVRVFKKLAGLSGTKFGPSQMEAYKRSPKDFAADWLKSQVRGNPLRNLDWILEGCEAKQTLERVAEGTGLLRFREHLNKFIEFRNNIVHGQPVPELETFDVDFVRERWKKMAKSIQYDQSRRPEPKALADYSDYVWKCITSLFPTMNAALHLPVMGVVYPSMADHTISSVIVALSKERK